MFYIWNIDPIQNYELINDDQITNQNFNCVWWNQLSNCAIHLNDIGL